jgi:hypothetical protein
LAGARQLTPRRARRFWLSLAALALAGCAITALLAAGWLGRSLSQLGGPQPTPVIVRAGGLAISFEVTRNPFCSPLTNGCPAMPPLYSARYFTLWMSLRTNSPMGLTMMTRRLVLLKLD